MLKGNGRSITLLMICLLLLILYGTRYGAECRASIWYAGEIEPTSAHVIQVGGCPLLMCLQPAFDGLAETGASIEGEGGRPVAACAEVEQLQ